MFTGFPPAEELSDESLKEAYEETGNECMRKALAWSELVNGSMSFMHERRGSGFRRCA